MKQRICHAFLLLALCLTALGLLTGCAQFSALFCFLNPPSATQTTAPTDTPNRPEDGSVLSLAYDERITLSGILLGVSEVSTQDEFLVDVLTEDEKNETTLLHAVGVGSGKLRIWRGGEEITVEVRVSAAPLAVFFLLGEEDALGSAETPDYPIKAADGRVYYSLAHTGERTPANASNAAACVPSRLTDTRAVNGGTLFCPPNELSTSGRGRYGGIASSFAYKWSEQTGERVWILNLAQDGSRIADWLPGSGAYATLLSTFSAAKTTLDAELADGHYRLTRMSYLFCQGESDAPMTADAYLTALRELHCSLCSALTYTTPSGEQIKAALGGLIACRAAKTAGTGGVCMNGPRAAQHYAANAAEGELATLHMLSCAADYWYSDAAVAAYFARYDARSFRNFYGYAPPTSQSELIDKNGAYTAAARNELGAEAAENLLYLTGLRQNTGTATVTLLGTDGIGEVGATLMNPYGVGYASVVPLVSPIRLAKVYRPTLTLTAADGRTTDTYYLQNVQSGTSLSLSLSVKETPLQNTDVTVLFVATAPPIISQPKARSIPSSVMLNGPKRHG